MAKGGKGRGNRDLRCYVTLLQDNRERKEMAEKSLRRENANGTLPAFFASRFHFLQALPPSPPLTPQPPRFVFGGTSSWIRHWVTGSAHRSICSVATMTSAAAGKWPLQARHMLLLRPATSAPRKRGASPLAAATTRATRRRRVNNVWAAPESRQRFFALLRGE
ncbi:LOW QUALITY PROTEIN: uncharacterized protein Dsimw501_GD28229 [Drosophila simulans]|nr:LOW QUALITY PROTEIN: uncharacterized protein Dsimw501_GD28229 [Drosophila simulans]